MQLLTLVNMTNSIPQKNMEMMKREMIKNLLGESMGGNAGFHDGNPCAGANFYYNKDTGEIVVFTNEFIRRPDLHRGAFRIVFKVSSLKYDEIIEWYIDEKSSEEAKNNIERSVALFNDSIKN
ncbi:MAG: hypothetical protein HYS32_01905 [Candidatus Woesearchaeota archaeon]|nr:MAG: hypothetical protein HYS32_01905 [Candidatus Woesearchaeota archaeon]